MFRGHLPQVAIMVETSRGYARDILRGILRYEMKYGPWDLYTAPAGRQEQKLPPMRLPGKKGIIAHVVSARMAKEICNAKLPTVSVFPSDDIPGNGKSLRKYAEVRLDSPGIGIMAAQHLLECRFTHFGTVGEVDGADWSTLRCNAFVEAIVSHNHAAITYPTPNERNWDAEQKGLTKWLKSLPKPVGIFAATDIRARNVIEACKHADLKIPEEVAVIGVDNDELFCETTSPKLSSVAIDAEGAGYESARALHRLMHGTKTVPTMFFGALRVVARRSSDVFLVDDLLVRKAVNFIRDCYAQPITVQDVARTLDVSRRQLEIRFKKVLGRSIFDEIKRRRLHQVRSLLTETDFSLDEVAQLSGFQSKNYLVNVFRKEFGTTMMTFRKTHCSLLRYD